ncbi:ABC transporter ATP-binding protein [Methylobacterium platani]|uniref:Iron ABC transporter ATP-binding protein n=2 Tax=Methylobacterium platani TaxID=427683 RepID=A0A179S7Z3_9HYPH|nr:ABC transporter ATP-binding protein [Methylobacterium platani]KMO12298.1 iron ABC transporter ATP-binding protein [Methylobacterium platani JCM 14648]OAS23792.1 iron ABC transporter ATP-binding protein [Methylobacterium platani]
MTDPAPSRPAPALAVEDLACRFGRVQALAGVSLAVRPGEVMALLGDSGCGKSTLLRVVAGLEAPDSGTVRLDGRLVAGGGARVPPEARGVGLMFQDYALFPHLTVRENIRFGLKGQPQAVREAADDLLAQVGLASHAESYPQTLSGGEQQRVALVRALAPGPRLLLLDEPFSNLDRRMRDRVREDTVALLRRTGTTALMVTHDPEEALAVATRIALMRRGRIVQVATGEALYRRPESLFAARFLADAVEIPARVAAGRADTPLGTVPAPHLPEGAAVRVCLRPEALAVCAPGRGLAAQVLRRTFLGAASVLHLRLPGIEGPLRARLPDPGAYGPGDAVGVTLVPEAVLVLPDEEAA